MTGKLTKFTRADSHATKIKDKIILYAYYRRLHPPDRRIDGVSILEFNSGAIGTTFIA